MNIWNILTTPNPNLVSLIMFPLTALIELPLSLELFVSILNISPTKKQRILYVVLCSIISTLTSNLIPSPYNFILNYTLFFIVIYNVFKLNILKTTVATLLPAIVFSLSGLLILNPYLSIFNTTIEASTTIPLYRFIYLFAMYTLVLLLVLIIKFKNLKLNMDEKIDKRNRLVLFINMLLGLVVICVQTIITFYYVKNLPLIITFLNFIGLFFYFAVSIYSLSSVIKLANTTQKLENSEAYIKTLRILHDNVRGFKHDFDNIVTTIGGYIKTNDMSGLETFYSQLVEDCQKVNNLYLLNPSVINNPGVYSLLTTKYNEAEEKNIKVSLQFLFDLNNLHMKIYEFTRILGILLDNAIDAASESENKIINIVFRDEPKNHRNIILIENTYNEPDINIDNIFNKGVSGKENHTGLGLWEVRKIIKKNNNVNLFTNKNDTMFSQQLEIYY